MIIERENFSMSMYELLVLIIDHIKIAIALLPLTGAVVSTIKRSTFFYLLFSESDSIHE